METNNNEDRIMDTANDAVDTNGMGKKRNVKGIIIAAVIAVLAIAGVAGAMNAGRIGNLVKQNTSSPEEYYRFVERENRDKSLKNLSKTYSSLPTNSTENFQQKVITRIEVGESLKPLLSSLGMENIEIEANSKMKDKELTGKSVLKVNGGDALTYNVYLNYETGKLYMQIPELSNKYIDFSSLQKELGINYASMFSGSMNFPDEKSIENIMKTYTDIALDDISDVKKTSDKIEAEGVSAKCTKLEAKVDADTFTKIVEDAAKKLETDEDIKNIIEGIDSSLYPSFQEAVKSFNEDMASMEEDEEDDDDFNMQMDVYVDKDGNIIGRAFSAVIDEDSIKIQSISPEDGNKFGYEFSVEVNGVTYVTLSGSGERKSGKLNATYHLSMDESLNEDTQAFITDTKNFVTLEVKDFDEEAWEDGVLKGEYTLSSDKITSLALYSVTCKFDGNKNDQNMEISVLSAQTPMLTMTVATSNDAEDPQVALPGDGADVLDASNSTALEDYMSEVDIEGFLKKLKDNCGVDLTSMLSDMFMMGDDSYSDLGDYESTDLGDILGDY